MAEIAQNYQTHRKFVPLFHYVLLPILFVNVVAAGYYLFQDPSIRTLWGLVMALALNLTAFFARVFALGAQDRVIRLEERMRMQNVLPPDLQARIPEFTRDQVIALRFASDAELPTLAAAVLRDRVEKREAVKKLVTQWRADDHQL